jgi:hypothetical protein
MAHRIHPRGGAILAVALTGLALSSIAVPASARTFDFNATGSMVQQAPPPGFACATRRAMLDHRIPCRGIYAPGDGVTATVALASRHAVRP